MSDLTENLQTSEDLEELKTAVEDVLVGKDTTHEGLNQALKLVDAKPSEWLKELLKKLETMPRMKLTVAITLPPETVDRMSRMVKQRLGPEVVLDIDVDRQLVGGAVVEFKGKYYDGSLKKKLDEFFAKNQNIGPMGPMGRIGLM